MDRQKIIIGNKWFRIYDDLKISDKEYIITMSLKGFDLIIADNDAQNILYKKEYLTLNELNRQLPIKYRLSCEDIVFILLSEKDES